MLQALSPLLFKALMINLPCFTQTYLHKHSPLNQCCHVFSVTDSVLHDPHFF